MFAITSLYKSAKSLLLNPHCQDITEKNHSIFSRKLVRTRHQKENMSREIERKKDRPRLTPASGNKKRCLHGDQVVNGIPPLSIPKKQKVLPMREKDIHKVKDFQVVEKLSPGLQKDLSPEETPEKAEICDELPKPFQNDIVPKTPLNMKATILEERQKANSQHHRFGSEDPAASSILLEDLKNTVTNVNVEQSERSEDDAPEVMRNKKSEQIAKMKIECASKASEAQKLVFRQKKKQLQKQKKMVKPHRNLERAIAPLDTKAPGKVSLEADEVFGQHKIIVESQSCSREPFSPQVISKYSLPDLLPLEYLEDDVTQRRRSSSTKLTMLKPKKIKFDESGEQIIKNRRVGSTTYRVIKASSKCLAPKAALNVRKTKEAWLQGRSSKNQEPCRRAFIESFVQT